MIMIGIAFSGTEAYAADRANIAVGSDSFYTIANKKMLYDGYAEGDVFTGNMKTFSQEDSLGDNDKRWSVFNDEYVGVEYWLDRSGVVVNDSDEFGFTYIPTTEQTAIR